MMYQNAVYKSLNLNLSPSNSSRSGTSSRDISIRSRDNSATKNIASVPKLFDNTGTGFKFQVGKTDLSSERRYKPSSGRKVLKRDLSTGNNTKNHIGVSRERKSALTNQFYSPSDPKKGLKYRYTKELSVEK